MKIITERACSLTREAQFRSELIEPSAPFLTPDKSCGWHNLCRYRLRKRVPMRKLCVCAALMMILLWRRCWAQASRASEIDHRWEIYGGLALTGPNPSNARSGGGGGLGWYPVRWLGVQGDCSVVFQGAGGGNNTTLTDFLIGPRLGKQASGPLRVSPFVDLLFGLQHMNNSSSQPTTTPPAGARPRR
jgi:hypothetical protein